MKSVRRGTFETNSSSSHSFSIKSGYSNHNYLKRLFDEILDSIDTCYDAEELLEIIKTLHEAEDVILKGTEVW